MNKYLSVFLWAAMFSGVYASEKFNITDESFDIESPMIDENEAAGNNSNINQAVQRAIRKLERCRSALVSYSAMLDTIWPAIEVDLQGQPDMIDEFRNYKGVIQDGCQKLSQRIDQAIDVLSDANSDISELKEFRFSELMSLFTQRISQVLTFCNRNHERLGDDCYNKIVPVLQKLLRVSVALQTVFLFKEIFGDNDTTFSCDKCCLLL